MSTLATLLPAAWRDALTEFTATAAFDDLSARVAAARNAGEVFPPEAATFRALELTAPEAVRVVILGQDPYHDHQQAHGLAFSVPRPVAPPPSLKNIFKELTADLGLLFTPTDGDLSAWARQGVLLLNTTLTVNAHAANSHKAFGWEAFSDAVIQAVARRDAPTVFILWGAPAQRKAALIDPARHHIIASAHPSPLSAYRGFFGSRPFSRANAFLAASGRDVIHWNIWQ